MMEGEGFLGTGNSMEKKPRWLEDMGMCGDWQVLNSGKDQRSDWGQMVKDLNAG